MIKTRFAPSPTGFLHVGGLRTALFEYLFAKKNNGVFLMRIEDTDRERFVEGGVENLVNSLKWVGIEIDEGVDIDENGKIFQKGDHGPYIQSERLEIYQKYLDQLIESGNAYHCFCSRERLDELRKMQELNKQATGYDGLCRNLTKEEVESKINSGESSVVRMKMPDDGVTKFTDMVRGEVEFQNSLIDDQIIRKTDGFPTYHLANVVDDHEMKITHVIRGEEWLPSTPKHIMLYNMFGWEVPEFAHLSLLVNEKKAKLSKRHGDVSVEDFKEKGYLPEALINFIAFLGWNPGDEREFFSLKELEQEFDFEKVAKSPAVFNREKLAWYNKEYFRSADLCEFTKKSIPFLVNAGLITHQEACTEDTFEWLKGVVALEKERAETFSELVEALGFIFAESLEYESELLVWKKSTREDAQEKLGLLAAELEKQEDWNADDLEKRIIPWIKENEFGVGDVLWPTRVALSGQKNSPGPFEIAAALGKEKALDRINFAIDKL